MRPMSDEAERRRLEDVRQVLRRFQEGYARRDPATLDAFMDLFVVAEEPELVGTEAVVPGDADWGVDRAGVRAVIEWDWRFWWNVRLDVDAARIRLRGDVAWLSAPGLLLQCEQARLGLRREVDLRTTGELEQVLRDADRPAEARLADVALRSLARVRDYHLPPGAGRPFTFTAVLVRADGSWRFHTIQFSIAAE